MDYYLLACGAIFVLAICLNMFDRPMLLLTIVVGVGFFLPAPRGSADEFYAFCITMEIFVGVAAWYSKSKAGYIIVDVSLALVITHLMGYALDGNPPFSPYRLIVKILEVTQLMACAALSPIIYPILRNHDATTE